MLKAKDPDGFEGNAQTFRVLNKLGVRFTECDGLNLTRATLNACLKYPWLRDPKKADRKAKWGAYRVDRKEFEFAREFHQHSEQSTEAALMDWADDIAYSVHDLEDFHRCGAIPWAQILNDPETSDGLIGRATEKWFGRPRGAKARLRAAFERVSDTIKGVFGEDLIDPYDGSRAQRLNLRSLTSLLVGRYLTAVKLEPDGDRSGLVVGDDQSDEVKILKQITKDYIISNPSLAAQQHGQRLVITDVFQAILKAAKKDVPNFLPIRLRYIWELSDGHRARFAADCIASLSERELVGLHGRLFGTASGSVLDPIVR